MKQKILSTLSTCFISACLFAQISTITVAEKATPKAEIIETIYDSTTNCPKKNFALLVGQEIYVLPLSKYDRDKGYKGFKTAKFNVSTDKETAKRYGSQAPNDKLRTKAEELENKVFTVVNFAQSEDKYPTYCLSLAEKSNPSNTCKFIFQYESTYNQTFATMKHYTYLKKQCVGKVFYFTKCCLPKTDNKTGEVLQDRDSHSWTCKDIIISPETGKLTMLLQYENSETYLKEDQYGFARVTSVAAFIKGESKSDYPASVTIAYSQEEWDKNVEKYGEEMMWLALKNKIVVGMPYDLVLKSIGRPTDANVSSHGTQLYYKVDLKTFVQTGNLPFLYYQNGKNEIYVYIDENKTVTGWN